MERNRLTALLRRTGTVLYKYERSETIGLISGR